MSFKKGDIVRLKKEHKDVCPRLFGRDIEIAKVEYDLFYVKEVGAAHGKSGDAFFAYRLELVAGSRVEGRTIAHRDIKVGDTIRNTMQSDDLKITREGVVESIGSGYSGSVALWTADHKRIDVDVRTDTYTLVKAAPQEDKILKRVKESKKGDVVTFLNVLGMALLAERIHPRVGSGETWSIHYSDGWKYKTDKQFADILREDYDKARWLS